MCCIFVLCHSFGPDLAFSWEYFSTGFPRIIFRTNLVFYLTNLATRTSKKLVRTNTVQNTKNTTKIVSVLWKRQIRPKWMKIYKIATHRHKQYIISYLYIYHNHSWAYIYLNLVILATPYSPLTLVLCCKKMFSQKNLGPDFLFWTIIAKKISWEFS